MYYTLTACYLCLHLLGDLSMRYMAAFIILASLVLPAKSVTANVLSPADYENFYSLDLKMLSIGDAIYGLVANQPGTHSPDCVIELAFKFDAVQADLHGLGTLVALATNVTDHADELRVIQRLSLAGRSFLRAKRLLARGFFLRVRGSRLPRARWHAEPGVEVAPIRADDARGAAT